MEREPGEVGRVLEQEREEQQRRFETRSGRVRVFDVQRPAQMMTELTIVGSVSGLGGGDASGETGPDGPDAPDNVRMIEQHLDHLLLPDRHTPE